jgi:hypothetical protein
MKKIDKYMENRKNEKEKVLKLTLDLFFYLYSHKGWQVV